MFGINIFPDQHKNLCDFTTNAEIKYNEMLEHNLTEHTF